MIIACESCYSMFELNISLIKNSGSLVRCSKCKKVFRVYPHQKADSRKSQRVKTKNLISYFSFDETGKLFAEGLGMASDISKDHILLETPNTIESGMLVLEAIDDEKNLIEVKGKLIHSKKTSTGMVLSEIKFIDVDERVTKFIATLIREYNYRVKNRSFTVKQKNTTSNLPVT